ncbi:putative trans-sialidase, Group VI [Trypanosoma cruzi]|nr:putative trans-sialidase, Group VI [Trypanosoma cruzi]
MLSRVAAVKAPRTHNRRRVTGSSGRRREGRESEPPRPNMSRHVLTSAVLLPVVMCCNTGGAASNEKKLTDSEPSKGKLFGWRETTDEGTVISLFFPSLVEVNGDVFAVAEAHCKEGEEGGFTGFASELLALTGEQPKEEELDENKMKRQVLEECPSDDEKCATQAVDKTVSESETRIHVSKPTTVVHGSVIYMLVGMYNRAVTAATGNGKKYEWGLLLTRRNVSVGHTALPPHNHTSRPIIVTHLKLQSYPTSKALAPSSALLCVERRRLSRGLRVLPNKALQLCPNITGSLAKKETVCDVTNVSIHKFRKRFIGSLECPACARMHDENTHGASRARSSFQLASPPGESLAAPSRFTKGQITLHT